MLKMVANAQNGCKCSKWLQMVHNATHFLEKWLQMVHAVHHFQRGSFQKTPRNKWCQMVPNGQNGCKWCQMVKMVANGTILSIFQKNGCIFLENGTIFISNAPIFQKNGCIMYHFRSNAPFPCSIFWKNGTRRYHFLEKWVHYVPFVYHFLE